MAGLSEPEGSVFAGPANDGKRRYRPGTLCRAEIGPDARATGIPGQDRPARLRTQLRDIAQGK